MAIIRMILDGETRDFDYASFRLSEADDLMRLTGWTRQEWLDSLWKDHPDAFRFLWFVANKRNGTPLAEPFREIDFDYMSDDFVFEVIKDEPAVPVEGAEGSDLPTGPLAT